MKQETEATERRRRRAELERERLRHEAMKTILTGGHVNGAGWRMEFLRLLARARADGLLTVDQIKRQLPADLLLAVEALAEELRNGSHVMPLVVLGNDWDFGGRDMKLSDAEDPLFALRLAAFQDARPGGTVYLGEQTPNGGALLFAALFVAVGIVMGVFAAWLAWG